MATRLGRGAVALFACGLVRFAAASSVGAAEPKDEVVEAEMLRDLDLLREAGQGRSGEFFRRMRVLERFRLLEALRLLEGSMPSDPALKEGK